LYVAPNVASGISTTTNFGDSITCGVGASVVANGYASLLDAAIGKPATNLCYPGDQAADMAVRAVYPDAVPTLDAQQLFTAMIGINDANHCGGSAGCVGNWMQALEASLTWLALPASDKIWAQAANVRTGNWHADGTDGLQGLATTNAGASLTFQVKQAVAGHSLYVAYRVLDAATDNPGTAAIAIDGQVAGTLSSAPTGGQPILTQNGTNQTIFVDRFALGAVGPHTVTVTITSTGGGLFSLGWLGTAESDYTANSAAPRVVIGSITSSGSSTLNTIIVTYNTQLTSLIAALTADGMRIGIAPTASALNPATDLSDNLHPNDAGHLKLAKAFAGAL
jgi:lysophospholipase L1-like esterase